MIQQRFEIDIRTTPDELWRAIVDPAITPRYYFESTVECDWRPQSPFKYIDRERSVAIEGIVLESDPPRRLVTTFSALWDSDVARDQPHRVTWEIIPIEEGCHLSVVHEDYMGQTSTYQQVADGMPVILAALKQLLEGATNLTLVS